MSAFEPPERDSLETKNSSYDDHDSHDDHDSPWLGVPLGGEQPLLLCKASQANHSATSSIAM